MKIDAQDFEKVTKSILAPVYPVIAENIIKETGVVSGLCIDLGAGPGNLGLELAKLVSGFKVILLDMSEEMLKIAEKNCKSMLLGDRISFWKGKVEQLPFQKETVDLAVSRGSIFFWEDQVKAINEVYRVLRPGGYGYLGGGFGNEKLLLQVRAKMRAQNPEWDTEREKRTGEEGYLHFSELMKKTKVPHYKISRKQAGLWIIFKK